MFKNRDCPYCNHDFDDALDECPYCHARVSKKTNNVSFIPYIKQIIVFAIGLFGFQLLGLLTSLLIQGLSPLVLTNPAQYDEFLKSAQLNALTNFITYIIVFIALVLTLWKDNIKLLKTFKNWLILVSAIAGYLCIFVFNIIYGTILDVYEISIKDNTNESLLSSIIVSYPLLSILIFAVIGPICEEITYRVGLYSFFRRINKYLAYLITIVIFALIHFDFMANDIVNEFLNLPYYLFAAFVFCFLYEKFGFAASVSAHITNNIISIVSTIVLNYNK